MAENPKSVDPTPRLMTPDGPKPPAITREELYELLKPTGQNEAMLAQMAAMMAESMAAAVSKATADAQNAVFDKMSGESKYGEWNIANFPDRSVFNPLGENEVVGGLARPELDGEVFWVGTPMDDRENTREEIEWANLLMPGIFHDGQWKVRDLAPGQGKRALLVVFPCVEPDQRAALPSNYPHPTEKVKVWDVRTKQYKTVPRLVTGTEQMLREMVEAAQAQAVA